MMFVLVILFVTYFVKDNKYILIAIQEIENLMSISCVSSCLWDTDISFSSRNSITIDSNDYYISIGYDMTDCVTNTKYDMTDCMTNTKYDMTDCMTNTKYDMTDCVTNTKYDMTDCVKDKINSLIEIYNGNVKKIKKKGTKSQDTNRSKFYNENLILYDFHKINFYNDKLILYDVHKSKYSLEKYKIFCSFILEKPGGY